MGRASPGHELELLPAPHAICRLNPGEEVPVWARGSAGAMLSVTRTDRELSIVCESGLPPAAVQRSGPWRALRIAGSLDHSLVGILSALLAPLAEAEIPIFAISTFDTDYLLVGASTLAIATEALTAAGHEIIPPE